MGADWWQFQEQLEREQYEGLYGNSEGRGEACQGWHIEGSDECVTGLQVSRDRRRLQPSGSVSGRGRLVYSAERARARSGGADEPERDCPLLRYGPRPF